MKRSERMAHAVRGGARLQSGMQQTRQPHETREYGPILREIPPCSLLDPQMREPHMQLLVDALWAMLSLRGVSWIGFYLKTPLRDEMVLGPRRDRPACSPIGLHGMCGRCWLEKRPVLVRDVATLGENYVACDPRDKSEVVIPLFEADGRCYGVLDADSYEVGSFETSDVIGLTQAVEHAGLSAPAGVREILRL